LAGESAVGQPLAQFGQDGNQGAARTTRFIFDDVMLLKVLGFHPDHRAFQVVQHHRNEPGAFLWRPRFHPSRDLLDSPRVVADPTLALVAPVVMVGDSIEQRLYPTPAI
jgi:hypothetical protein